MNNNIFKAFISCLVLLLAIYPQAWADDCETGYIKGVNTGSCIKASGSCGSGCTYTIDEKGNISMTGNGNGSIGSHIIRPYTSDIVSVSIGEGIKTVGFRSFDCDRFRNITIAEGVTTINGNAFGGTPITALVIPSSVTSFGGSGWNNAYAKVYCTSAQIANCGSKAVLYEKKGDLYYTYDADGNVSEVFSGFDNFNSNVVKPVSERDKYKINEDGSVSIMDKNGTLLAKYGENGKLLARYAHNPDGSIGVYDANGKLTGLKNAREITPVQAAELVRPGKNNTVTLTFK